MNFQKKLLPYILLVASAFMLWNFWQVEHAPAPVQTTTTASSPVPTAAAPNAPINVPAVPTAQAQPSQVNPVTLNTQLIHVKTDVLDVAIDMNSGNLVQSSLLNFPQSQDKPNVPLTLFTTDAKKFYQAQSGFLFSTGQKEVINYTSDKTDYVLSADQKSLTVTLNGTSSSGMVFTKAYTFYPASYSIDQSYSVKNNGATTWDGYYYSQLVRSDEAPDATDGTARYTFFGAATSTPEQHYNKISFSSMDKEAVDLQKIKGGWVAMLQHYFVSALVPNKDQDVNFYSNVDSANHLYTIGVLSPMMSLASGQNAESSMQLYSGPATAKNLEAVAPNLKLTIDYGWLWFISVIIFWLMQKIHEVVGNWGWSIVLVTVVIKAIFYQLSAKSYKSMAAMKKLQPQIKILQERFKDNKQELSKEMMGLYKKEKVNPLGGCFPLLIQIPVFIALYWVIVESVQLRQAPFIFWIHDLAMKDPFYVMPVIMGLTMFIQQKISPPPPDPVQAKVMMLLPVIFTVFFLQFPAGLVLYWIVNNTLSISQQWYMMRKYSNEPINNTNNKKQKKLDKKK
ncbi:MAG: membrane protein insertase YidC [Pseudomonadota bacterium]